MHSNASFQRNERTRREARQDRAATNASVPKPCYVGKRWTRTDHKRALPV